MTTIKTHLAQEQLMSHLSSAKNQINHCKIIDENVWFHKTNIKIKRLRQLFITCDSEEKMF